MAHCPPDQLKDLADVLAEVRALPGVSEPRPGIFYLRRTPFLHFHSKDGKRWADVRAGRDWGTEVPLPFDASAQAKTSFLRTVERRHRVTAGAPKRGR